MDLIRGHPSSMYIPPPPRGTSRRRAWRPWRASDAPRALARVSAVSAASVMKRGRDPQPRVSTVRSLHSRAIRTGGDGLGGRPEVTLENLLDNAVRYTDAGFVRLEVENRTGAVVFHVRDTCGGPRPPVSRTRWLDAELKIVFNYPRWSRGARARCLPRRTSRWSRSAAAGRFT